MPIRSSTDQKREKITARALRNRPKTIASTLHASVLEEARRSGLLEGEKTEHVSFRAPLALLEAAKKESGVTSTSDLGMLALAILAKPDPVAAFFRRTEGRLGSAHDLEH